MLPSESLLVMSQGMNALSGNETPHALFHSQFLADVIVRGVRLGQFFFFLKPVFCHVPSKDRQ